MEAYQPKLAVILETSVALYQELQALLQRERDAIVGQRLDTLTQTGQRKEDLLLQLQQVEVDRKTMLATIAHDTQMAPERLTLSCLTRTHDGPESDRIRHNGALLLQLVDRVRRLNRSNERLLRHSLEFVRGSMSILKHLMTPPPTYQKDGLAQGEPVSGRMIHTRL